MKCGIVFDVDGVLIDVENSYRAAIKLTAQKFLNREVKDSEVKRVKLELGINNDWFATKRIIEDSGMEVSLEEIIREFNKFYETLKHTEKLLIGHGVLREIRELSRPMGVVTGRPRKDLEEGFNKFSLWEYFDFIVDEDTIPERDLRKPHPFALSFCLKNLGVDTCVYIGDTLADYMMLEGFKKQSGLRAHFINLGPEFMGIKSSKFGYLLEEIQEGLHALELKQECRQ
ncbi:MAG: HAD-IA family hydrolase [Aquificaceae bacterium]